MKYNIRINFNGFTCWYNELENYFNNINWHNCKDGDILYYSSSSEYACYNFRIIEITNKNIVELIAIPE